MKQRTKQPIMGLCGRPPRSACGLVDEGRCATHWPRCQYEQQRFGSTIAEMMARILDELEEG